MSSKDKVGKPQDSDLNITRIQPSRQNIQDSGETVIQPRKTGVDNNETRIQSQKPFQASADQNSATVIQNKSTRRPQARPVAHSEDQTNFVSKPEPISEQFTQKVKVGSILKGRFELLSVIGMGGMGIVYKAKDLRQEEAGDLDPFIALKVLSPKLLNQKKFLIAMQQETKKTQTLSHPNIVNVYDFDKDGDVAFMTMELLNGHPLDSLIKENKLSANPKARKKIIHSLISGLTHAHENGIVHADFKPNNVFIENNGNVKIFDFGIAHAIDQKGQRKIRNRHFDAADLEAVTPRYASVGALQGQPISPSDDYYALGCVIYMVLTGEHPYGQSDALTVRDKKLKPKAIESLSSSEWNALESLLDAQKNPPKSLDAFQQAFFPASRSSQKLNRMVLGASSLIVIFVLALGFNWFQGYRLVESSRALITSEGSQSLSPLFDQLDELEKEQQEKVAGAIKQDLIDAVEIQVNQQIQLNSESFDLRAAKQTLDRLGRYYPDSVRISALRNPYQEQERHAQNFLREKIQKAIADQSYINEDNQWGLVTATQYYAKTNAEDIKAWKRKVIEGYVKFIKERIFYREFSVAQKATSIALKLQVDHPELIALSKKLSSADVMKMAEREENQVVGYLQNNQALQKFDEQEIKLQEAKQKYLSSSNLSAENIMALLKELKASNEIEYYALKWSLREWLSQRIESGKSAAGAKLTKAERDSFSSLGQKLFPEQFKVARAKPTVKSTCFRSMADKGAQARYRCRDRIAGKYKAPELVVVRGSQGVKSFAMSHTEVSNKDYRLYCKLRNTCKTMPANNSFPVTGLSTGEINAYIKWLSDVTDFKYRLPSEKEWLLAAKSSASGVNDHNCLISKNGKIIRGDSLREVDKGYSNAIGIKNMIGNVAELVRGKDGKYVTIGGHYETNMRQCGTEYRGEIELDTTGIRLLRQL